MSPGAACLAAVTERDSRLPVRGRSEARTCEAVGRVEVAALRGRPLESVTPGRGKEFANHREASAALGGVQSCFCPLPRPRRKPTVENTDGLIREFFPKGTGFSKAAGVEARRACGMIDDRPRKVLGYRTANEVYREMLHSA